MKVRILQGDVLDRLADLPDESVHCVVTSPPYWGLRDYGTGSWSGGDPECDHVELINRHNGPHPRPCHEESQKFLYRDLCVKCGARRVDRQLGLEATPEDHVARMVEVFAEVRRVLRKDGVCWLNYGDLYVSSSAKTAFGNGAIGCWGLKSKNLVGMPWRIAFALQADGWYLRSDVIWHKPTVMPESVTDRPTKAHEYVFLLTKSARYYYDADAVREKSGAYRRWLEGTDAHYKAAVGDAKRNPSRGRSAVVIEASNGRNLRTVWTIPPQPMPDAHFATFPEKLVHRCILAGCPEGGVVLDPFLGSGTTAWVAAKNNRDAIGIELNPKYIEIARRRIGNDLFVTVEVDKAPEATDDPKSLKV